MEIEQLFGRKISATESVGFWSCLWGLLFLLLVAGALVFPTVLSIAWCLLPLSWLIAAILGRPRRFQAEFTELEMILADGTEVPYLAIQGLTLNGASPSPETARLKPGKIVLFHNRGALQIPRNSDPPILDVYRFLWQFVSFPALHPPLPELEPWYREQVLKFGSDQVATFMNRFKFDDFRLGSAIRLGAILSAVVGAVWIVIGMLSGLASLLPAQGIVLIVVSFLVFLASFADGFGNRQLVNSKSMLIVSPGGLGLKQALLQGTMEWRELLDVKLKMGKGSFRLSRNGSSIRLKVAGAEIQILDIYDRPLSFIYEQIENCRRVPV